MSDETKSNESNPSASQRQIATDQNALSNAGTVDAASLESGVPTSRAGQVWVAIVVSIVLLILLVVFIFQNLDDARIHFFTATGTFPLALALLLAAIVGALIVVMVGSVRILQLRRHVRNSKHRTAVHDSAAGTADPR